MRKSTMQVFTLALLTVAVALVQAQAKSDFSGTWKANTSKSDFGPMPAPDSIIEKIVHQDPSLKVNFAQTGGPGDMTYDMVYTTDGKECANKVGDDEYKTMLKWDADDLVAETKGSFQGTDFTAKDRWALSDGGKTLTVTRHISTAMGEFDMKLLFEKQ
jgi:hypothetical protein